MYNNNKKEGRLMENKKVFISYSWDSDSHKEWVLYLVNELRKNGIDAEADVFETQLKSVSLPQMMVNKVRDSNFVIIVLTEGYANKADKSLGGVGFESQLMLPLLMENPDKLICIMRHQGDYSKVFPFQLKGQYAIDFSNEKDYEEKLKDLIYRIYGQARYYKEPLGKSPEFSPRVPTKSIAEYTDTLQNKVTPNVDFSDLNLSSIKRITDQDIDRFLKESYKQIIDLLGALFTQIKINNPEFYFDHDVITNYKSIFTLYVDGKKVNGIKIWYDSMFGSSSINLSYGYQISLSDNSMNERIIYHMDDKKQLRLKMTMNMFGNTNAMTAEEVVKEIWKNNLSHNFK